MDQTELPERLPNPQAFDNPQALQYKASALSWIYMVLGNKPREDKARDEMDSVGAHVPHVDSSRYAFLSFAFEWFVENMRVLNPATGMRVFMRRMLSVWGRGILSLDELKENLPDFASLKNDNLDIDSPRASEPEESTLWPTSAAGGVATKFFILVKWLRRDDFWEPASSDLLILALLYYRQLHHINAEENSRAFIEDKKQSVDAFNDT